MRRGVILMFPVLALAGCNSAANDSTLTTTKLMAVQNSLVAGETSVQMLLGKHCDEPIWELDRDDHGREVAEFRGKAKSNGKAVLIRWLLRYPQGDGGHRGLPPVIVPQVTYASLGGEEIRPAEEFHKQLAADAEVARER